MKEHKKISNIAGTNYRSPIKKIGIKLMSDFTTVTWIQENNRSFLKEKNFRFILSQLTRVVLFKCDRKISS